MSEEDNVFSIEQARQNEIEKPIFVQKPRKTREKLCFHSFELHEDTREVICRKCGGVFDPFDALWYLAGKTNRMEAHEHWAKNRKKKLTEEVEELERKKRNLKASIRRMEKKK